MGFVGVKRSKNKDKSFLASHGVTWMCAHFLLSRESALEMGRNLHDRKLITSIHGTGFVDAELEFKFNKKRIDKLEKGETHVLLEKRGSVGHKLAAFGKTFSNKNLLTSSPRKNHLKRRSINEPTPGMDDSSLDDISFRRSMKTTSENKDNS